MYGQQQSYPMGRHGSPMPPEPPTISSPAGSGGGNTSSSSFDSNVLGLLRNMEREDLQNLNDRTIESLISDDADLNKLQETKLTEAATNRSLAEHSLSQQTRLEQGRRALISAHKEAADLARQHRELSSQLAGGQRGESIETLHSLLQSACLDAEESGESILEQFLSRRLPLPEFISKYTDATALYHTRRAKTDKVTELSNQRIVQASAAYRTTSMPGGPAAPAPTAGPFGPPPSGPPPSGPPPVPPPHAAMPPYYYPAPGYQQQQPPYSYYSGGGRP